jgi:hypothetical protein
MLVAASVGYGGREGGGGAIIASPDRSPAEVAREAGKRRDDAVTEEEAAPGVEGESV